MFLQAFVTQGLRGFPPSSNLPLKAGYTVIGTQAGAGLWPLFDLVVYADPKSPPAMGLAAEPGQVARLGLTFLGKDGATYRIVRPLDAPSTLAKQGPDGKFHTLIQGSVEVAQYMRAQLGLPSRSVWEQLLCLRPGSWPSRQIRRTSGSIRAVAPVSVPSVVAPPDDVEGTRAKLAVLKKEMESTKELEELQFKLDGAQKRIFDLEGRLKQVEAPVKGKADAERDLAALPSPEAVGLPSNLVERAQRLEAAEQSRDEQLRRLSQEREQFLRPPIHIEPLQKDRNFVGALGAGLAFLVLGIALGGGWKYLALLDIPAFGGAALIALKWVSDLQFNDGIERRKATYDEREKQVGDQFENEALSVRTAMKVLKVASTEELVEMFSKRTKLEADLIEFTAQIQRLEGDGSLDAAREEMRQAQAEAAQLENRLTGFSGYARMTHQIESEMKQLEAQLAAVGRPAPVSSPGLTSAPTTIDPGMQADDPAVALMALAAEAMPSTVDQLGLEVTPRAAQYLAALSDKRLSGLQLDPEGHSRVVTPAGPLEGGALEAADRDLLHLALKLTLMERLVERIRVPLLFDDPFGSLDPARQALLGRMLKGVAAKGQLLHLSSTPGPFQPSADEFKALV